MSCLLPALLCPVAVGIGLAGIWSGDARAQAPPQKPQAPAKAPVAGKTLSALLEALPWHADRRGPLLVVNPSGIYRSQLAKGPLAEAGHELRQYLPDFGYNLVSAGSLSVIAPQQMVHWEDSPQRPVDLFAGLPRELKVKYLLSTLNAKQWDLLGTRGLGAADLDGEQLDVFQSLLPNPFKLQRTDTDDQGRATKQAQVTSLSAPERAKVRLKVFRTLELLLQVAGQPEGAYPVMVSEEQRHPARAHVLDRERLDGGYGTTVLGAPLRSLVPNRLKPSDLDYHSPKLDGMISLHDVSGMGDLVRRVGMASGLELHADRRVASLPVLALGDTARAGDILQALALAVTGTFRKVDTAYILTGDRVGAGTRVLRWADWENQLQTEILRREKQITAAITDLTRQGSGIHAISFAADDPYAPTPELLEASRNGHPVAFEQLTAQLQDFVADQIKRKSQGARQLQADSVEMNVSLAYAFQLPNGAVLPAEAQFGNVSMFEAADHAAKPGAEAAANPPQVAAFHPPAPVPLPAWANERLLMLAVTRPLEAEKAVLAARRLGFTTLVLRTENMAAIRTAIQQARQLPDPPLKIDVALAPFALEPNEQATPDLTLLGETAAEVYAYQSQSSDWANYLQAAAQRLTPHPAPELAGWVHSARAPVGPGYDARLRHLVAIASIEGLDGIFCYETAPTGYLGQRSADGLVHNTLNGIPLYQRGELGYAPALRLAFVRQEEIDPLDLITISIAGDVNQPFFAPIQARANRTDIPAQDAAAVAQKWDRFRDEVNREALARLYEAVHAAQPGHRLYIETRPTQDGNLNDRFLLSFVSWSDAHVLPEVDPRKSPPARFSSFGAANGYADAYEILATWHSIHPRPAPDRKVIVDFGFLAAEQALMLAEDYIAPPDARTAGQTSQ